MEKAASFSLINLVSQADIVVQFVMALLILASLWSWAIIFDKIMKFMILGKRSDKFEQSFDTMVLEDIMAEASANDNHPLSRVFIACMNEWQSNNIKAISAAGPDKKNGLKERLNGAMQIAANRSMQKLENGLGFLAVVGSSMPFVGLFGTVWGIMNSFQGIAVSKNTSLAVVAPGIAEALLATGIGLFAAIPAVFFYNIFSNKINNFSERVNNFSIQLLSMFSKELDK